MKTVDGRLYVISGASRSGKTAQTRNLVRKSRRIFAWDPEDQWAQEPGWRKVTTRAQLLAAAKRPGPQRIAYVAGGDLRAEFDFCCACVFFAGRHVEPVDYIAEELADVSTPAKAPPAWGILVRRGLKRGISIYAISQRWAEADKTAVGNATDFIVFRASSGDDEAYISRKAKVPLDLYPQKPLHYVHKDALTGAVRTGKLTF